MTDQNRRRPLGIALVALASAAGLRRDLRALGRPPDVQHRQLDRDEQRDAPGPAIRSRVAEYLVDQVYANVDVEPEIRAACRSKRSRSPARRPARCATSPSGARSEILSRPAAEQAWEDINRRAHERSAAGARRAAAPVVSTDNGTVSSRSISSELLTRARRASGSAGGSPEDCPRRGADRRLEVRAARDRPERGAVLDGWPVSSSCCRSLLFGSRSTSRADGASWRCAGGASGSSPRASARSSPTTSSAASSWTRSRRPKPCARRSRAPGRSPRSCSSDTSIAAIAYGMLAGHVGVAGRVHAERHGGAAHEGAVSARARDRVRRRRGPHPAPDRVVEPDARAGRARSPSWGSPRCSRSASRRCDARPRRSSPTPICMISTSASASNSPGPTSRCASGRRAGGAPSCAAHPRSRASSPAMGHRLRRRRPPRRLPRWGLPLRPRRRRPTRASTSSSGSRGCATAAR